MTQRATDRRLLTEPGRHVSSTNLPFRRRFTRHEYPRAERHAEFGLLLDSREKTVSDNSLMLDEKPRDSNNEPTYYPTRSRHPSTFGAHGRLERALLGRPWLRIIRSANNVIGSAIRLRGRCGSCGTGRGRGCQRPTVVAETTAPRHHASVAIYDKYP